MKTRFEYIIAATLTSAAVPAFGATDHAYVPLGDAGQVQIIDTTTDRVVATVDGLGNVHGLAATPDGRFLVAGSMNESAAGDAGMPARPAGVSEDEHAAHHAAPPPAAEIAAGMSTVSIVDTATRRVVRRIDVRGAVHHVSVAPDGRLALTTHPGTGAVSVLDLHAYRVVASIPTGPAPNYATFNRDGTRVYVSNAGDGTVSEIDMASLTVSRRFDAGKAPEHVVLAPDGRTLYVNNVADGTVSAIRLADGRTTARHAVGAVPHGIDISDDGTVLYVSSNGEGKLVAIDLPSGTLKDTPLAPAPYHVATIHGRGTVYVSSRAENRIRVLDQKTLAVRTEIAIGGIGHQMVVPGGSTR